MGKELVYFGMGPLPVYVGVCFTERAFKREVKRLRVDDPPEFITPGANASTHEFHCKGKNIVVLICMDETSARVIGEIPVVGILAHEALHAMEMTVEAMREKNPGDEFKAYCVQWITQNAFQAYKKLRKRKAS